MSSTMESSQKENDRKSERASEELLDAIPVVKSNDETEFETDSKTESSTFCEFLLYLPILLQSLGGTLYFFRSLVLGHIVSRIFQRMDYWNSSHAWPPPSLLLLAILTFLAFLVHPDGGTWILLRHLR